MKDLQLKLHPDKCLRVKCTAFPNDSEERIEVAEEMIRIMYEHNGLGLSANQVGLYYNVFVMRSPIDQRVGICLFNPKIISVGQDKEIAEEGCLSLLGKRVKISRFKEIEIQHEQIDGSIHVAKYDSIYARCVQHEMDHLNGVLIFDHINSNLSRKLFLEKYYKVKRRYDNIGR